MSNDDLQAAKCAGSPSFPIQLANPEQRPYGGSLRGEPHTSGMPGGCSRTSDQPGREAREHEGCCGESLSHLHGGVPYGVRKGAFKTCLLMVLRHKLGLPFALASNLPSLRARVRWCPAMPTCSETLADLRQSLWSSACVSVLESEADTVHIPRVPGDRLVETLMCAASSHYMVSYMWRKST